MVNTCAFIEEARAESVETILQLEGAKPDGAHSVVLVAQDLAAYSRDIDVPGGSQRAAWAHCQSGRSAPAEAVLSAPAGDQRSAPRGDDFHSGGRPVLRPLSPARVPAPAAGDETSRRCPEASRPDLLDWGDEVLIDMVEDGVPVGRSHRHAPEIDGVVSVDQGRPGEWVRVRYTGVYGTDMEAVAS